MDREAWIAEAMRLARRAVYFACKNDWNEDAERELGRLGDHLRTMMEREPPTIPSGMALVPLEPTAWRRPWDGDESDLGKFIYADTRDDMEDDAEHAGEYVPLYEHPPTGEAVEAWKKRVSEMIDAMIQAHQKEAGK